MSLLGSTKQQASKWSVSNVFISLVTQSASNLFHGQANIKQGLESSDNKHFTLHDSLGLESGDNRSYETIEKLHPKSANRSAQRPTVCSSLLLPVCRMSHPDMCSVGKQSSVFMLKTTLILTIGYRILENIED